MATVGPQDATVGANVAYGGSAWASPSNIANQASTYTTNDLSISVVDDVVQLTFDATTPAGTNQSAGASWPGMITNKTFGSSSSKWGVSPLLLTNIKGNSDFGVLMAASESGFAFTDYICATGFDFSAVPDGSTVDGLTFTLDRGVTLGGMPLTTKMRANKAKMTMDYTAGSSSYSITVEGTLVNTGRLKGKVRA